MYKLTTNKYKTNKIQVNNTKFTRRFLVYSAKTKG